MQKRHNHSPPRNGVICEHLIENICFRNMFVVVYKTSSFLFSLLFYSVCLHLTLIIRRNLLFLHFVTTTIIYCRKNSANFTHYTNYRNKLCAPFCNRFCRCFREYWRCLLAIYGLKDNQHLQPTVLIFKETCCFGFCNYFMFSNNISKND